MDFVCFVSACWYESLWTNKEHVMSRFAARRDGWVLDIEEWALGTTEQSRRRLPPCTSA